MKPSRRTTGWLARIRAWRNLSTAPGPLRRERGRAGERLAAAYLRRAGYVIEAANVRFPAGELDVVAREGDVLCFVEVRARSSTQFGSPQASITLEKRRRFVRAVRWYLQRRRARWEGEIRFDVVAIQYGPQGRPDVELIRGAFRADD